MLDIIREHWAIMWALGTVGFNVILFTLAKTYAKRDEVETLKSRLNGLETSFSTLPNQKDLHALQLDIAELRGDLKAAVPELRQLRHMSDLLLQNELKNKD
ncbi:MULTISPECIES: DUF2730 family protein [Yersinia pseudotuberculosis complex]|uniref:DUF2730 family protein n=1 Tax=Yersinia pseudotuberculosis complex TaxID=1649845 RepID=UPI0005E82175|nr:MULTISPECIES: DUF2730 family protein [Yersinia pseudotuberculosis complex]MBK1425920.1 DUF2730 domain-containing protein [Yersinia pseudotuberculosis]MBK1426443.1 DUF2730 domain-containing protein [Yersinia pseudotuberculosis]CNC00822.1 Protein of uncharacterised function (DUF2730) [Yersinia similis]CNC99152.1 Protein of uncharacterised function (DUF2730) [Yersinia pseudotuberculosis]CNF92982.1 Protein of uncharacterised function (DUF2730) [Yersinia pseudotuberculosis]